MNLKRLYFTSNFSYLILGAVAISLGPLMPYLMDYYSFSYIEGATLFFLLSLGNFLTSIFGGMVADLIGRKIVIYIGTFAFIVGFTGFLLATSVTTLYPLVLVLGFGWGIFNFSINSLVGEVSKSNTKQLNILHSFFAAGALSSPLLLSAAALLGLHWKVFLYFLILMSVIFLVLLYITDIPKLQKKFKNKNVSFEFLKNPRTYVLMAFLFFYVGSETSISGWMVTYLNDANIVSENLSAYFLSILWGIIIVGRVGGAMIFKNMKKEKILLLDASLSLVFLSLFLITKSPMILLVSVVALGLSYATVYPTVVGNAGESIGTDGTAIGSITALGGLGGAIIPWLNGMVAENFTISIGMLVIVGSTILMILSGIINLRLSKK